MTGATQRAAIDATAWRRFEFRVDGMLVKAGASTTNRADTRRIMD